VNPHATITISANGRYIVLHFHDVTDGYASRTSADGPDRDRDRRKTVPMATGRLKRSTLRYRVWVTDTRISSPPDEMNAAAKGRTNGGSGTHPYIPKKFGIIQSI
jgi:hypothetical protein